MVFGLVYEVIMFRICYKRYSQLNEVAVDYKYIGVQWLGDSRRTKSTVEDSPRHPQQSARGQLVESHN